MGYVEIPLEAIFGAVGFLVQVAVVFATLAVWGGRIDQRLKAVEAHSETVQKVGPLEAKFEQFERAMENRLEGVERAVREAAAAIQTLAIAMAKRPAA